MASVVYSNVDGRGVSDLKQGVTLQVMGEGWTMGPLTPAMRDDMIRTQSTLKTLE